MDIDKAFGKLYEEVKIDEAKEFWAVIDKAKGGEVMAISSDEKGAKSSVKMSNFSKHDYHFGKDPRTLKIVKVMGKHSQKKAEKMIGTKLSFRKEEVEKRWTGGKLPPHLAKFFDKDGNLKKDAADRIAKGRAKLNWKDVTPKGYGPKEEVEIDEAKGTAYPATVDTLRKIVKDKQNQVVMFDKGQARVDTFTASAIIAVYDGLKKSEHKKTLEDMIKTKEGFLKTQAFAMKMVK